MRRNRILSVLLALLLALALCAATGAAEAPAFAPSDDVCLPAGDADRDGEITAADARLLLRYSVELETPSEEDRPLCDLDGDGHVTASDARLALRIAVELENRPKHLQSAVRDIQQATCLQTGLRGRYCARCGLYYEKGVIPRTDHVSGGWIREVEPTCTDAGRQSRSCLICGELLEVSVLPELGHLPDTANMVFIEESPDCTKGQYVVCKCLLCGEDVKMFRPASAAHRFRWVTVKAPTCTEQGFEELHCEVCNKSYSGTGESYRLLPSLGGHEWVSVAAPTPEDPAREIYKCKKCGETVETLPEEG